MTQKKKCCISLIFIIISAISISAATGTDLEKGISLYNAKEYDKAKKIFSDINEKDPKNPEACYYLGRICFDKRSLDEAIGWFEKAVKLNENSSNYHLWLGNSLGERGKTIGKIRQAIYAKKVKAAFERAIELDAGNNDARYSLIQFYMLAPGILGGSREKAYEQAGEIRKRDVKKGHEAFIYIYNTEKKFDLSEKEYFALIGTDPGNVDYHNRLAWFYIILKEYKKAYDKLVEITAKYPKESPPYYTIGYLGFASGSYLKHAEECMIKFFDIISSDAGRNKLELAWYHYVLGGVYEKNGKKESAKKEYETAVELNPDFKDAKKALERI